jgi:hypothetical protein
MSELESAVARFQTLIAETPYLWQSIDVRVLARELESGPRNLLCTAFFDRRKADVVPTVPDLPFSPPVACYQRICRATELDSLLAELCAGSINFGGVSVAFTKRPDNQQSPESPYAWAYVNRAGRLQRHPEVSAFPVGHVFTATGDSSEYLFRQVDDGIDGLNNALRRLPKPWDGVDSIARVLLKTNNRVSYNSTSAFELFAPLEARIQPEHCSLWSGNLTYSVVSAPEARNSLRLGYFGTQGDGTVLHGEIPLGTESTMDASESIRYRGKVSISHVRRLSLFLSIANSNVDRAELVDLSRATTNPRVGAYSMVDENLAVLQAQLVQPPGSRLFEKVVSRLFGFGGFLVDGYAFEPRITQGPDAIAFASDNSAALVLEYTTGPIGPRKGKLGLLVSRTARLREILGEAAPGVILPIIATALPASEVSNAEYRDAAMDGIAVLAREDLTELLDLTLSPVMPSEILDFCLARVPRLDDRSPFGAVQ